MACISRRGCPALCCGATVFVVTFRRRPELGHPPRAAIIAERLTLVAAVRGI